MKKKLLLALLFLPAVIVRAQIDDIGAWAGAGVVKCITRELDVTLAQQIRFHQDVTRVDLLLTDAGVEYAFTKKLKAGLHYRFINSNRDTHYSKRHRLYADVSWREKVNAITFTLRERIQQQYTDVYSSETGKIPVWTLRSKLSAKYNPGGSVLPYVSAEMYYVVDNVNERDQRISRFRYEAGVDYEFNRMHSINPFLLFQHAVSPPFDELIYGISYTLSL